MSVQQAAPLTGERRPVSALFADLVGSTSLAEALDPEDWAAVANQLYDVASEAIARYEGTVTQLSGDAIVAVFGAPVAHEDDPERAVRAALDLIAAVDALSARVQADIGVELQVRVGVNTGLAVVGSVGGDRHEEYTALGDAMNVAARMQTAARPGTVLITDATYGQVLELVDVVDVGALEVKGKTAPVAAYEVTRIAERGGRPRGIPGLESPMVGRAQELERLVELLTVVRAGRGRMALLLGEPGIGKSRLLAELRAGADEVRWIEGRCLSYGRSLPYHLVADLVSTMAGADGEPTVEAVEQLTTTTLDEPHGETTGHLLHLLGLPTPPEVADRLDGLDPVAVRRRHVDALVAVLGALARSAPIALVCEDLHWSDAASADVLIDLARVVDRCPVLFLGTARPDRESEGWRFVTEARADLGEALTELRLEALSLDDTRALVANLLEIESLPADVRRLILERTDGNPFFVEEVVRALIDQGLITRRGERWVAHGHLTGLDVPETIQGLLLGRIDRLPDDARRVLGVASVLGRTFTTPLLAAVTDELDAAAELGTLEAHGLIHIAATSPELSYAFRHALVQEAAYSGLLKRERQTLHGQVADVLEEAHRERPEEVAALLAHHLDLAREHERAVPHLLEAGRQAFARYAHREAHALFTRAVELVGDRTDEEASRQRVEARAGQFEAGTTFVPAGENLPLLQAVLPEAEALGDERLLARVHVGIAWLYRYLGELGSPELHTSMERAFELSERLDDDTFLALPLEVRADLAYGAGEYREAVDHATRAAEIRERREQLADAAVYTGLAAVSAARIGEFDRADELVRRGQELAERSGVPHASGDIHLFHGMIETERGNLEEAVVHTTRGLEQANELGNTDCQLVGNFNLGDLHLRMGDAEAAIPMLEQSSEIAEFCNAGAFAALSGAWLAAARLGSGGELTAELSGFEEALASARESGMASGEAEIYRQRATVRAAQPDPDWNAVVADFEAAIAILERLRMRPGLARTLHDYGMALDVAGRPDDAAAALKRAADLFEEMGIKPKA